MKSWLEGINLQSADISLPVTDSQGLTESDIETIRLRSNARAFFDFFLVQGLSFG
jgi:hypothetical protein